VKEGLKVRKNGGLDSVETIACIGWGKGEWERRREWELQLWLKMFKLEVKW